MHPTIILLATALVFGAGITLWPCWRAYVKRHWATPEERWHQAEEALGRAVERSRQEDP